MLETEASRERWSVRFALTAVVISLGALLVTFLQLRSSDRAVQVAEHARQDAVTEAERQRVDAKNTLDQQREDTAAALEAQTKSAKTATQQLEMSERPWVVVEFRPSAPLEFSADGSMSFEVLAKFTNIGHSVALNVSLFPLTTLDGPGGRPEEPRERQKDVCDRMRKTGEKFPHGETLFPNDFTYYSFPLRFSKEDIDKVRIGKTDTISGLMVVGCVDYTFSFSPKHHQTGYIFNINRFALPGQSMPQPIRIGETLMPDELVIKRSFVLGGFYAD